MELVGLAGRVPGVFEELARIRAPLDEWIQDASAASVLTPLGVVKLGILFRAVNQHGAIANLLASNYVEDGLILTRSLLELVLHTEELVRDETDVHNRALRYLQFCRLERFLENREMQLLRRSLHPDRANVDDDLAQDYDLALKEFSLFGFKDKKGRHRWFQNWCNTPVAVLAGRSSNRMRIGQYRVLYAMCSRMSHSGPAAVFPAIGVNGLPTDVALHQEQTQLEHLCVAASFASVFLSETVAMVSDRIPTFSPSWMSDVVAPACRRMLAESS